MTLAGADTEGMLEAAQDKDDYCREGGQLTSQLYTSAKIGGEADPS